MKNYFWNLLTSIQNGQLVCRSFIYHKNKKINQQFLKLLWSEGFILGYKVLTKDPSFIKIFLKYSNGIPVLRNVKLLSKPSRRVYYNSNQIWRLDSQHSLIILSTSQGFKTHIDCKKFNIGGEAFVKIN